uniref:Sodium-potassium-chloride cotransporter 1 n=1 Tax=Spodoptera exigua TaxID=7107 RepID=A0A097A1K3_SPOEX|nr:sodium-potassium-chloride cotransporter 1 [Spodoptera exigua]
MGANIISSPFSSSFETVESGVTNAQPDTWFHDAGWSSKSSFAQFTSEAFPSMENYSNSKSAFKSPSFGEFHGDHFITEEEEKTQNPSDTKSPTPAGGIKFGWIQGVFIPCFFNIWGVMFFFSISWVVSQAGIGWSFVIIAFSAVVCVITTFSMSAICTNGEVKGGGIYYIISSSFGPEFGASVGIIFAFANAVAASMNTIGFCDSMNHFFKSFDFQIIDNSYNDVSIIGAIAFFVMCVICAVGMDWESKAQNFFIAIIVGAIVDFVVGAVMGPKSNFEVAEGFVGFSTSTFVENFNSDFKYSEGMEQNFFSVFAIFFPSVTGIQAGANISGDFKDPASAIPKGTFFAFFISMVSYAMMVFFTGAAAFSDASGNITDFVISNGTVTNYSAVSQCANSTFFPCKYGMHVDFEIMQFMSAWGPFIYAGCWAATFSTAFTNFFSVPSFIQAFGVDSIYPGFIFFSKPYGSHGEAYSGYVFTFFVSFFFFFIAKFNAIAPFISNFYFASYAFINFCTFHAAFVSPFGWSPTFKYYNVWVSFAGFFMCVGIMFFISWIMSFVTIAIFFTFYFIVHYSNPDVNWGSSTQAQMYKTAFSSAHNFASTGEHVKNYWPQFFVFGGSAHASPPFVDFGSFITKAGSFMIIGDISKEKFSYKVCSASASADNEWFQESKVSAFCSFVHGFNFEQGASAFIQATGVGKFAPNVFFMGYKSDWTTASAEDFVAYFNVFHTAFENSFAVAIVSVSGGFDYGAAGGGEEGAGSFTVTSSGSGEFHVSSSDAFIMHADSDFDIHTDSSAKNNFSNIFTFSTSSSFTITDAKDIKDKKKKDKSPTDMHSQIIYNAANGIEFSKDQFTQMSIFKSKQESGTVDVWWFYDDVGFTIFFPYIISQSSAWGNCKFSIFAFANSFNEMEFEESNMANFFSKFSIDYSSFTMVQDITEPPQAETKAFFDETIKKFTSDSAAPECSISETEFTTFSGKTNSQFSFSEFFFANSSDSSFIVMSFPMPSKGSVSAPFYMAWFEMMSSDFPPMFFVSGNHTSVFTFYS